MASEHVKNVSSADFDAEVLKSNVPVVVDFWAEWCGPCKRLAPLMEEIAQEHTGKLKVVKVDVDHESALASKYGIQSIPTLIFFKGGAEVGKHIGLSSKKDLVAKIPV
jgi:thioredoxin 1